MTVTNARRMLTSGRVATCGRCGATQPVIMPVDDFRCETCAVGEVDEAATRETRAGFKFLVAGAVLIVLAVLMGMAGWNPGDDPHSDEGWGLLPYVASGGLGLLGLACGAFRYRPPLRR
jgi:hypothetical protein